jgi:hypothetical protein
MKLKLLITVLLLTVVAVAEKHPDFSGSWQLNAEKSKNLGMMSQMDMTLLVEQSPAALDVTTHTIFQGQASDNKTHYDLTGKPVQNELPMSGVNETLSKWSDDKLLTTWSGQSAVAGGPKVVRLEKRSLSPDKKTMTVESTRGSSPAIVMVFEKK